MTKFCCSLVCSPDVEEKLLDTLLIQFPTEVFASTPTFSHGASIGALTPEEQVLGRSRSLLVQIVMTADELDALRILLREQFAGTGIRYWLTPVLEEGDLT